MTYEHPTYTVASVAAQSRLASLNTDRLAFAGAYHGWGFHEDGCRSGAAAAAALGAELVRAPARVRARVRHRRTSPFTYEFAHRTTMWLVDAADPDAGLPEVAPRAGLDPAARPLRARRRQAAASTKVRGFLAAQDLAWSAEPGAACWPTPGRSGYVFDPLTTYFCLDADGRVEGVLAEVHNTYGERHCYPLAVEPGTAASVDKEFYVSPFFAVDGRYDIRTRLTDEQVAVAISLTQGERVVFTASVHGALEPASPRRVLAAVARNPLPSQRVSALIRWHGIRLWLRRLPVVPRRPHHAPKGMA